MKKVFIPRKEKDKRYQTIAEIEKLYQKGVYQRKWYLVIDHEALDFYVGEHKDVRCLNYQIRKLYKRIEYLEKKLYAKSQTQEKQHEQALFSHR